MATKKTSKIKTKRASLIELQQAVMGAMFENDIAPAAAHEFERANPSNGHEPIGYAGWRMARAGTISKWRVEECAEILQRMIGRKI